MMGKCLPSVDIVIVNFKTPSLVIACLSSIEAEREDLPHINAIVVDNASSDGSIELLKAAKEARAWDWVTLLEAERNGGFGAGNNIGITHALSAASPADFLWLLNPDTEVRPSATLGLVRFMASCPRAGIAGSSLLEGDGRPWPYAFRFPTILSEVERGAQTGVVSRLLRNHTVLCLMGNEPAPVDWVSGASLIVRRDVLDQGLRFDEEFFLYYEETDFCLQARRLGWECWYVPDPTVLHIAGQSTGVTGQQAALRRMPGYWFQSRRYYFQKNHGSFYAGLADIGWIAGHLVAKTKRLFTGSASADPPRLMSDFLRHSVLASQKEILR